METAVRVMIIKYIVICTRLARMVMGDGHATMITRQCDSHMDSNVTQPYPYRSLYI
jgi:hypothetical protein